MCNTLLHIYIYYIHYDVCVDVMDFLRIHCTGTMIWTWIPLLSRVIKIRGKRNSCARVLAFCNVDADVIDQLEIAKVLSYVGTKFVCQDGGGKLSGFHLASRIWFQISLGSLPIEKQSALIATIGWLKTHYPSFRIIDPVCNIRRLRNPKTFLRPEERVFGSQLETR